MSQVPRSRRCRCIWSYLKTSLNGKISRACMGAWALQWGELDPLHHRRMSGKRGHQSLHHSHQLDPWLHPRPYREMMADMMRRCLEGSIRNRQSGNLFWRRPLDSQGCSMQGCALQVTPQRGAVLHFMCASSLCTLRSIYGFPCKFVFPDHSCVFSAYCLKALLRSPCPRV